MATVSPTTDWAGPVTFTVDPTTVEQYLEAVGDATSPRRARWRGDVVDVAPPFILSLAVNRAARLFPSPPGSVHARQRFEFHTPVVVGARLRAYVRRGPDELKRGRRHAVLQYRIIDADGAVVATAESRTIRADGNPPPPPTSAAPS